MPIRVGLVGYGLGGATFHAPLVSATDGMRLVAIVVRDPTRRADAAKRYPGVRLLERVEHLWHPALALDLVVVSSPSGLHAAHAIEALGHGRHVVVDKPFATTPVEARRIRDAALSAGRLAIPFQNRRWDGDFLTLRRLLADDRLGAIHRFESRFERWRDVPRPRWTEPGARAAGEGIVHDIGSHLVDQALLLFGPALRVSAQMATVQPGALVEQDAVLVLEHLNGVHSYLVMSAVAPASGARFTLLGSRGAYVKHGLDGQEAALKAGGDPASGEWGAEPASQWGALTVGSGVDVMPTLNGRYPDFYAGVRSAIEEGTPPPVLAEDAVMTAEVLAAAFRSADEGIVVGLT